MTWKTKSTSKNRHRTAHISRGDFCDEVLQSTHEIMKEVGQAFAILYCPEPSYRDSVVRLIYV